MSTVCNLCQKPQYCPGGHPVDNPDSSAMDCKPGLASMFNGAESEAACLSLPGFSRNVIRLPNGKLSYTAVPCPLGTFNVGGNSAGCVSCGTGLSTNDRGKTSDKDCGEFADACGGFYVCNLIGAGFCVRTTTAGHKELNMVIKPDFHLLHVIVMCSGSSRLLYGCTKCGQALPEGDVHKLVQHFSTVSSVQQRHHHCHGWQHQL